MRHKRMYYKDFNLYDLFRIRDCLRTLVDYGIATRYLKLVLNFIELEIERKADEDIKNKSNPVVPQT